LQAAFLASLKLAGKICMWGADFFMKAMDSFLPKSMEQALIL